MPGEDGSVKVRDTSFGKVSVVQMARAVVNQAAWVSARLAKAEGILSVMRSMGSLVFRQKNYSQLSTCVMVIPILPLPNDPRTHDQRAGLCQPGTFIHLGAHSPRILQPTFPCHRIRAPGIDHH